VELAFGVLDPFRDVETPDELALVYAPAPIEPGDLRASTIEPAGRRGPERRAATRRPPTRR
jgi:hypothetical protein